MKFLTWSIAYLEKRIIKEFYIHPWTLLFGDFFGHIVNAGKQIVCTSTDGMVKILQDKQEQLTISEGRTLPVKHARWLFDFQNNHQDQKTYIFGSCATLKKHVS